MAIANNTASLSITIEDSHIINQGWRWQPLQISTALVKKIWWHTHAYGAILGIILLALASVIFLGLHWCHHKLWPVVNFRASSSHE